MKKKVFLVTVAIALIAMVGGCTKPPQPWLVSITGLEADSGCTQVEYEYNLHWTQDISMDDIKEVRLMGAPSWEWSTAEQMVLDREEGTATVDYLLEDGLYKTNVKLQLSDGSFSWGWFVDVRSPTEGSEFVFTNSDGSKCIAFRAENGEVMPEGDSGMNFAEDEWGEEGLLDMLNLAFR